MSDKIRKFLAKLPTRELVRVETAIKAITSGNLGTLNVKPIKGKQGYCRVRIGRVRIIYRKLNNHNEVVHVNNRDNQTYRNF